MLTQIMAAVRVSVALSYFIVRDAGAAFQARMRGKPLDALDFRRYKRFSSAM
jgi:hypothetical protein